MRCGVGMRLAKSGNDVSVSYLYDKGAAFSSGLLKVGDVLLAVDRESCTGKSVQEIETLLIGETGSNVQLKYRRGGINMVCTLTRESESEHAQNEKHAGWKPAFESPQAIANKKTEDMAGKIDHGQIRINENAVYTHLPKMTAEELARYNEERKKEADESIRGIWKHFPPDNHINHGLKQLPMSWLQNLKNGTVGKRTGRKQSRDKMKQRRRARNGGRNGMISAYSTTKAITTINRSF